MNIKNCNQPVADNIAEINNNKGLKKKAVAEKAGYSEQMLSDMLNGRKLIKIVDLERLRAALGVGIKELFGKDN